MLKKFKQDFEILSKNYNLIYIEAFSSYTIHLIIYDTLSTMLCIAYTYSIYSYISVLLKVQEFIILLACLWILLFLFLLKS